MQLNLFQIYLLAINILTFFLFLFDKLKAMTGRWRIKEAALLITAALGGAAGALIAMLTFRHKIRKKLFMLGVPAMLFVQILLLGCRALNII